MSPANLAWTLVFLGYWLQLHDNRTAIAGGIALSFLGLGTYQIVVGLPAMLVLMEASLKVISAETPGVPWRKRLVWIATPSFFTPSTCSPFSGFSDTPLRRLRMARESRQLVTSCRRHFIRSAISRALMGTSTCFSRWSYYFGSLVAWSTGWRIWACAGFAIPVALLLARTSARVVIRVSLLLLAIMVLPMTFDWLSDSLFQRFAGRAADADCALLLVRPVVHDPSAQRTSANRFGSGQRGGPRLHHLCPARHAGGLRTSVPRRRRNTKPDCVVVYLSGDLFPKSPRCRSLRRKSRQLRRLQLIRSS